MKSRESQVDEVADRLQYSSWEGRVLSLACSCCASRLQLATRGHSEARQWNVHAKTRDRACRYPGRINLLFWWPTPPHNGDIRFSTLQLQRQPCGHVRSGYGGTA